MGVRVRELTLVARDGLEVRVDLVDGRVSTDHVRVVQSRTGKELAYWSHDELVSSDVDDPASGLAAALSAIELVASGRYVARRR